MSQLNEWLRDGDNAPDLSEIPRESILESEQLQEQGGCLGLLMKQFLQENWGEVSGAIQVPDCSPAEATSADDYHYGEPYFREISPDRLRAEPDNLLQLWYRQVNDEPVCQYEELVEEDIRLARDGGHLVILVPGLSYAPQRTKVREQGQGQYFPLTDQMKDSITTHDNLFLAITVGHRGERRVTLLRPDGTRFKHYHSMSGQDCTGNMNYDVDLNPESLYRLKERFEASLKTINQTSLPDQSMNEVGPRNIDYNSDEPIENPVEEREGLFDGLESETDDEGDDTETAPPDATQEEIEEGIEQLEDAAPTHETEAEDWVEEIARHIDQDDFEGEEPDFYQPAEPERPDPRWLLVFLGATATVGMLAIPEVREFLAENSNRIGDWLRDNAGDLIDFFGTPIGIACLTLIAYLVMIGLLVILAGNFNE